MGNLGNLVTHANGYHVPNKRSVTMTLQPGEEISNAPAPGAMTPLQPLAQKRLETHFFDQCHGCYGWVGSDVVKEFQGIFVLPIADVARQCLCCQGVRCPAYRQALQDKDGEWDFEIFEFPFAIFILPWEQLHALGTPKWRNDVSQDHTNATRLEETYINDIKSRQKLPRKWQKLMPRFSVDFVRSEKVRGMRSYVDQFEMSHWLISNSST